MNDEVCEVIITAPDADWLAAFTRRLVEAGLAASGHQIAPIRTIYRWQGQIYDRTEARVALHTRRSLLERIVEETNQQHPYEVPCVISLPITSGNQAYLQWVCDSTIGPRGGPGQINT